MTGEEPTIYHSESELADLNAVIADELAKLGLQEIHSESVVNDETDKTYHLTHFKSRSGRRYQLYTVTDVYPSVLAFEYNIAHQIGLSLDDATIENLLTEVPDDFPVDVDENQAEAAGLIALTNMGDAELEELNYRIVDEINTDRVEFETRIYNNVIHSVRILGSLFPAEESHTIHHTEEAQLAIKTTAGGLNQFILYAFSGLDGKDTEDITSEGPLF